MYIFLKYFFLLLLPYLLVRRTYSYNDTNY